MKKIVGYFTSKDEKKFEPLFGKGVIPELGYCDKDHFQWDSTEDYDIMSDSDAKVYLIEIAMRVLKDNLLEYGKSAQAFFSEDRQTIGIFYDDGDISTYRIEEK